MVAFAILAAGCGVPIVSETTADSVEQSVEAASTTNIPESIAEGAVPVGESPGNTVANTTTTVVDTTTTTSPILEYSPAWIEWQEIKLYLEGDNLENIRLEDLRIIYNYVSGNTNDISTPMGALCWSFHELVRSFFIDFKRWILDDYLIPVAMEEFGVTSEQVGNPGPEATEAFLDLMSGDGGLVESIDAGGGQSVLPSVNGGTAPVGPTGEADDRIED